MQEYLGLEEQVVMEASEEPVMSMASSHLMMKVQSEFVLLLLVLLVVPEVPAVPVVLSVVLVILVASWERSRPCQCH